jgi:uncharacterized protein (DUF2141 family)
MKMMLAAAAFAAIIASTAAAGAAPTTATTIAAANVTIGFTGLDTKTGAILFVLFDSEAAFEGDGKPVRQAMVPANAAALETVFTDLPAGRYAVKAFHDIDSDGKMATNPFGMPTEPFAFSNNATGNMGPAKWADAAFVVAPGVTRHVITIR